MIFAKFPPKTEKKIAVILANTPSIKHLISFKPEKYLLEMGYQVKFIEQAQVEMNVSGRNHTARLYKNLNYNKEAKVQCDPFFQEAFGTWKKGQEAMDNHLKKQHEEYQGKRYRRYIDRVNYKD